MASLLPYSELQSHSEPRCRCRWLGEPRCRCRWLGVGPDLHALEIYGRYRGDTREMQGDAGRVLACMRSSALSRVAACMRCATATVPAALRQPGGFPGFPSRPAGTANATALAEAAWAPGAALEPPAVSRLLSESVSAARPPQWVTSDSDLAGHVSVAGAAATSPEAASWVACFFRRWRRWPSGERWWPG